MCGRYTLQATPEELAKHFITEIDDATLFKPLYNIAPSQNVPVVRIKPNSSHRELVRLRWGLIPPWSKDPKIAYSTINAKAETVAEKPAFRSAFRKRRCLIPADGFYEWQKQGKQKQPMYIHLRDRQPFAFAGLWERWESKDEEPVESCTIITTESNEFMRPIHHRMPVILEPEYYEVWLNNNVQEREILLPILKPYFEEMEAYHVSKLVNDPSNSSPQCIKPD